MQPFGTPPIWAIYLVAKREFVVVPLAFGFAAILAFRTIRSLRWAERSPYQAVTLLPGWLLWLAAFTLFYTGLAEVLNGVSFLLQGIGTAVGWNFSPQFTVVPLAPLLLVDAGVLMIGALWILLTGRDYPDVEEEPEDEAVEEPPEEVVAAPGELARPERIEG
jgi:hypothetical protein